MNRIPSHISIQELKACPEFAHLTDEEAQLVLSTIIDFCLIVATQYHNLIQDEEKAEEDTFKHAA